VKYWGLPARRRSPIRGGRESNSRPSSRQSNALTTRLSRHLATTVDFLLRAACTLITACSSAVIFQDICQPSSCRYHLLPHLRVTYVLMFRLRTATRFTCPTPRTKNAALNYTLRSLYQVIRLLSHKNVNKCLHHWPDCIDLNGHYFQPSLSVCVSLTGTSTLQR